MILGGVPGRYPPTSWVSMPRKWPRPGARVGTWQLNTDTPSATAPMHTHAVGMPHANTLFHQHYEAPTVWHEQCTNVCLQQLINISPACVRMHAAMQHCPWFLSSYKSHKWCSLPATYCQAGWLTCACATAHTHLTSPPSLRCVRMTRYARVCISCMRPHIHTSHVSTWSSAVVVPADGNR
jgi:hypothetical protein